MEIDKEKICKEYTESKIGVEALAAKYHVGKLKIKGILAEAGISIKKRGAQLNNNEYKINDWRIEKYLPVDGFHYIAVDRDSGFVSNDWNNYAGKLTSYIKKTYLVGIPSLYDRRIYYMKTGNYWWEQWFDIKLEENPKTKKCPYCGWETIDIENKSGVFEQHLKEVHHITKLEYLKEYPNDINYFKLKVYERKLLESDIVEINKDVKFTGDGNRASKWETVVEKMKKAHPDENLEYPDQEYKGVHSKIRIIDHDLKPDGSEYGEYIQEVNAHLRGQSYPGKKKTIKFENKLNELTNTTIEKFKKIHGDKYDYSKTVYNGYKTNCIITCKEHGDFEMTPDNHLHGHGCPYCGNVHKYTTEEWVEKARSIYSDSYDYSNVKYVSAKTPVEIICKKHGSFFIIPGKHISGQECPKCFGGSSKSEEEIYIYINNLIRKEFEIECNVKNIIPNRELDIYIPKLNVAIEYNGLYWHSEENGKNKNYHLNKLNLCNSLGIKLIQIFEDEYINHKNIVLTKISHIIGIRNGGIKVGARECYIKPIGKHEAKEFLDENHIQGGSNSTLYYGAFMKGGDNLVGVMSFRLNDPDNMLWELTRFATDNKYIVSGLGSKMFSYFKKNNIWKEVKSFADRRWTVDIDNNLYTKIGFKLDEIEKPDYRYVVGNERKHKFLFRKKMLNKKYGLPLTMTEKEMCNQLGFYRIWDCGLIKYVYKNPNYKEER